MDFQDFILNNFISFSVVGQITALDYKLTVLKAAVSIVILQTHNFLTDNFFFKNLVLLYIMMN